MRWLRSFPAVIPPHRAYVVDEIERLTITDFDYSPLGALDDDVCLIEWDMALAGEDRERFEQNALADPRRVIVAPYRLYHVEAVPVWAHRLVDRNGGESWIHGPRMSVPDWQDTQCDYFGFGLVHLPRELVRRFLAAPAPARGRSPFLGAEFQYSDTRMTDQTFSIWHRHYSQLVLRGVPIIWGVRPIHLHDRGAHGT